MANPLRVPAPLKDLADQRQSYDFEGKIGDFPRLAEVVEADLAMLADDVQPAGLDDSRVHVVMEFGWADIGRRVPSVSIGLAAELPAICQRCLEPFVLPLTAAHQVHLVQVAAESDTLAGSEAWEVDSDEVRPLDLAEEALVMALPLAATHEPPENCGSLVTIEADAEGAVSTPFADLRSQMEESN